MILGAEPNLQPHDVNSLLTNKIPLQRTAENTRKPHHPALRYLPFFDSLFGVMQRIEKDMSIYELLPNIERVMVRDVVIVPGTEDVDQIFKANKYEIRRYFREISQRIGGVPVRLTINEDVPVYGQITDVHSLVGGKWGFSMRHPSGDQPTVYHSAEEVRLGYRAAVLGENNQPELNLE